MSKVSGIISNLKVASAFPSLNNPYILQAPVRKASRFSAQNFNVPKDTFNKNASRVDVQAAKNFGVKKPN